MFCVFQVGDDVDVPLVSPADISYQVGNRTLFTYKTDYELNSSHFYKT